MARRKCHHCSAILDDAQRKTHDCWTTTEYALTKDLSEDLKDAWERLREAARDFGDQRVYASHKSIMFSRKACYFFVRPKKQYLEVVFFLGRSIKSAKVHKAQRTTKTKIAHTLRIVHRDEVEEPITDWLKEAYDFLGG